jgi:plasmid stabilization system protein ParE
MRPRLLVEPEAEAELDEAFTWYEGRTAGLGSEFLRAVRAAFALIRRNPEQFPRVPDDIRRALVRRFPYAVYYVVEPDHVSVFAVIRTRQHPRRRQSRR